MIRHLALKRALISSLTPRERQVFDHLIHGDVVKTIAISTAMSERAVQEHRHSIYRKLEVMTSAELLLLALSEDIKFTPGPCRPEDAVNRAVEVMRRPQFEVRPGAWQWIVRRA